MSVQRCPDHSYRVRWRDAAGTHRSKKFPKGKKQEAEQFERTKRYEVSHGDTGFPESRITLLEVGQKFNEVVVAQKKPTTQRLYRWLWNKMILPELGAMPMARISTGDVEDWLANLETGTVTKRKAAALLSQMFKFARKRDWVMANPCELADRPKPSEREPVIAVEPLMIERIRLALLNHRRPVDALLCSLMAYAGLRPHEARRLRWEDVKDKTLVARPTKTGRFRAVDLLGPVRLELMERKMASRGEWVLPGKGGGQWTAQAYNSWRNRVWKPVVSGLQRGALASLVPPDMAPRKGSADKRGALIRPYDLRHTFVSLLIRDPSYSRAEIAAQAGHSLEVQDRTYAHIFAELKGEGRAEDAIREARAKVFGKAVAL